MTLSTVTLHWDLADLIEAGLSATLSITPTFQMSDSTDHVLIPPVARTVNFSGGTGQLAGIVANDNAGILPAGTGYLISVTDSTGRVIVPQFQTQLNYANGATQWLDALAAVPAVTTSYQYLPLTTPAPSAGQVPAFTGSGWATAPATLPAVMALQAQTAVGGYVLQNAANAVILSWQVPADGKQHRAMVICQMDITSAQTGGQVNLWFNEPNGTFQSRQMLPGGNGTGFNPQTTVNGFRVQPGSTVQLVQATAQTAGAATLDADLFGL